MKALEWSNRNVNTTIRKIETRSRDFMNSNFGLFSLEGATSVKVDHYQTNLEKLNFKTQKLTDFDV